MLIFNTSWVKEHARENGKATEAAGGITKVHRYLTAQAWRRQCFFTKENKHQEFINNPAEQQVSDFTWAEQQTDWRKSEQQEAP